MNEQKHCKYNFFIPTIGMCCEAYARSTREDGKYWAHFPLCSNIDCPLMHPELLEGAVLIEDNENETLD